MAQRTLPPVPVKHADLVQYLRSHPDEPVRDLLKPYNDYDAVLRQLFAQEPNHPAISNGLHNVVPLYNVEGDRAADLRIRARDLAAESEDVKFKYIMPLSDEDRRPDGSFAVVPSLEQFQTNFSIFSEGSLSSLKWDNVLAVGSSVATALLPLPAEFAQADSKRKIRQFYHEKFAPAADVDLFLYGLNHEQAIEKIKHIERCINDSVLTETTTIRTKHAITIVSQYPTRHVQIVLRLYKSPAEILTGLDVDCSAVAYNGRQVYLTPRALGAYITQINNIDLSRRSPSYESRLSKYSRRGFEVFWPDLDRSRIDPTIYERNMKRIVGLARLLVLEKLPLLSEREQYQDKRRRERGRPTIKGSRQYALPGNLKDEWDDEVPDWMEEDQVSNYHTLKIPYGKKYYARKIEKILFTKDLLLNAEWNRPRDRTVNLHRHPAFFGSVDDVLHDCCGYCPVPETDEEQAIAQEESRTFISGEVGFLTDNPGRQEIGSFNPITEGDWSEMAYLGSSEGLCQAIVDHDLDAVKQWLANGVDINKRDHTGRTPLHLAAMASTLEILQYLVDSGARITWRLADGRSALHLAAARGNVEMVRSLMRKSEQNEEAEAQRQMQQIKPRAADSETESHTEDDTSLVSSPSEDGSTDHVSYATGSFVKVKKEEPDKDEPFAADSDLSDPDILDVNAIEWDLDASPLHLAIMNGHVEAVEELVTAFGADVLLPIKPNGRPRSVNLNLVLAFALPLERAKEMTAKLLQLGASPAQATSDHKTSLLYLAAAGHHDILDLYLHYDQPAVARAINHLTVVEIPHQVMSAQSPLTAAIRAKNSTLASRLLELGARPSISFQEFMSSAQEFSFVRNQLTAENRTHFEEHIDQPVVYAAENDLPLLAIELLARGADPNLLTREGYIALGKSYRSRQTTGSSLLDYVRSKLADLREYTGEPVKATPPEPLYADDKAYLKEFEPGSYQHWRAKGILADERKNYKNKEQEYLKALESTNTMEGLDEKSAAIRELVDGFEKLESDLAERGAKTFKELHPDVKQNQPNNSKTSATKTSPFSITLNFRGPDIIGDKRLDYLKLFEAAWTGDLDTIKKLTTTVSDDASYQTPLEIAICDSRGYSAFTIAVIRGHLDVAYGIIAIAAAQYKPPEEKQARYRMRQYDSDDDYTESDDDESDGLQLEEEIVETEFTIDTVGQIKTEVESKTNPVAILKGHCALNLFLEGITGETVNTLIGYAIWTDDTKLLASIISLAEQLNERFPYYPGGPQPDKISPADFLMAIRLGRLHCLEVLIKQTGTGVNLDELVAKSDIEVVETPDHYRGLSVRGKKRADWASRGRTTRQSETEPPLLQAARTGNLESVQWFLGPAPARCYAAFVAAWEHDDRVQQLSTTKKGLERTITDFLDSRRHLVLHCAVLAAENKHSQALVEYLANNMRPLLDVKNADGYTPLAVAFRLGRLALAKTLIQAGADQTVRDNSGNNLLHLRFGKKTLSFGTGEPIYELLELVEPQLLPSMLTERCTSWAGTHTPFSLWISRISSNNRSEALKQLAKGLELVKPLGFKHLELLDNAGNTPAHDAVLNSWEQTDFLLTHLPELAAKENVNGFTPADLAEQRWFAAAVKPPSTGDETRYRSLGVGAVGRTPWAFVHPSGERVMVDQKWRRYERCVSGIEGTERRRKLVTLFEASEFAAASYARFGRSREPWRPRETDEISKFLDL
ncbi:hypothetical protein BJX66DRAFT_280088 [Aspergillus keveii]|uniref:Ankyrin repeat protein n=1 Tax=Aspergillus keveii TaxID=714993 RepID=A0ABR4FWL7_9EURO